MSEVLEFDTLTPEQVQAKKAALWMEQETAESALAHEAVVDRQTIVAEGDSWFDYPPGLDILDHLRDFGRRIEKRSEAGATLEDMVYGTRFSARNWKRHTPQIHETLNEIRRHRPRVVLFSGGGNDLAGPELDAIFNHANSGLEPLREDYLEFLFFTVFKRAYRDFVRQVRAEVADAIVIGHGYAHPLPDGRGVVNFFNFRFIGPWLRPTFTRKNIVDVVAQRRFMAQIIDRLNAMLTTLANEEPGFRYLDLRGLVNDSDWVNELHLTSTAYRRVAQRFEQEIQAVLGA